MRTFKLIDHTLYQYQNQYDWITKVFVRKEVVPGIKVCSRQRLSYVGIVVDIGKRGNYYNNDNTQYVLEVDVFWLTGPHKGKKQTKCTTSIVNFDWYKSSIERHLNEISKIEAEADKAKNA